MRRFIALLFTLALLAGCGSSSSEVATGAQGNDDGRPQSFEDLEFTSPLGEFLGFDPGATDDMEAQFAEMEREAGRITTECMREKGFDYTPQDSSSFVSFGGPGGDVPYFSDEWVTKYGFGITTQRFPQSMVGDLIGFPDENFPSPGDMPEDPNRTYVEGLSDGEREAYYEALHGTPPDFDPEAEEEFMFEPSGCQGEAFEAAFSEGPGGGMAFYEAFGDELDAMSDRAEADPRVVQFNNEVTACVTAKGMSWSGMEDMYEYFEPKMSDLQPRGGMMSDPFTEAGLNPEDMTDAERNEFIENLDLEPPGLEPEALRKLGALQTEELELARVVVDCGGGPLNEQYFLGDIRAEYEQDFIDSNADALEDFKPGS